MKNKPYKLNVSPKDIPDADLPGLYRSLRSTWVLHLKRGHDTACDSLKPILDSLREELQARKLERTA